ncbi:MAG: sulfite exporter TauE/SafE family protein [Phycisphaerae bacterium]|nr:sulfite exporter TauE/SafE family protein [Phycisphaerae bacterium]
MFQATDYVYLGVVGLLAGWLGGLMGIGGSIIMIPAMTFRWGPDRQHLYQAAAMIVNVFVIAPALWQHARARATLRPILRWTVPTATLAALGGVTVSNLEIFSGAGQGYLQLIFGVFLIYVVAYNLLRLLARAARPDIDEAAARRISPAKSIALVGLPSGFIGGLLGVAGGAIAVPCQQVFLRMPLRRAIANSTAIVLLSSAAGAVVKNATLPPHGFSVTQSVAIAAVLIPTAFLGSWIGSALVHKWPRGLVRTIFVLFMTYAAYRMLAAGRQSCSGGDARPGFQKPSGNVTSATKT